MSDETTPLIGKHDGHTRRPEDCAELDRLCKMRWRSCRITYFILFISCTAYSMCLVSLFPFLQRIDPESQVSAVGWLIAAYSFGQMVSSPLLGWWANRRGSREPLIVSFLIFMAGNLLFASAESFPESGAVVLGVARAVIGCGAGNVAVGRAFVAGATTLEERTGAMTKVAAFQSMGFIFGPALQAAVTIIGYPGPVEKQFFHLNMYTIPAWISVFVSLGNIILVTAAFHDVRVSDSAQDAHIHTRTSKEHQNWQQDAPSDPAAQGLEKEFTQPVNMRPDMLAATACLPMLFATVFLFTLVETSMAPLSEHMFSWTNEQATLYCGLMIIGVACLSVITFATIPRLAERFDERRMLIAFLSVCMVSCLWLMPLGQTGPDIRRSPEGTGPSDGSTVASWNATILRNLTVSLNATDSLDSNSTPAYSAVGCPDEFDWCHSVPRIYLWQLIISLMFISVGYPSSEALTAIIYSKILGTKPQGVMMGWFTSTSGFARIFGPVYVAYIYQYYGPRLTFGSAAASILCAILIAVVTFRRLVPIGKTSDNMAGRQ